MATFHFFDVLDSTIDEAKFRISQGNADGSVIIAYRQSKGRGRRGRPWEDLPGNLYMTYITSLDCSPSAALQLSFVTCVAAGEALRPLIPRENTLRYKWPNDLLLNGKKVGGILVEVLSVPDKKGVTCLISCGLNLKSHPSSNVRYPTTSFQHEHLDLPLEEALQGIVMSLESYIRLWKEKGFSPIRALWMAWASGLDQNISFDLSGKLQLGIFEGIDEEGGLLLRTSLGLKKFTTGEILIGEQHAVGH